MKSGNVIPRVNSDFQLQKCYCLLITASDEGQVRTRMQLSTSWPPWIQVSHVLHTTDLQKNYPLHNYSGCDHLFRNVQQALVLPPLFHKKKKKKLLLHYLRQLVLPKPVQQTYFLSSSSSWTRPSPLYITLNELAGMVSLNVSKHSTLKPCFRYSW